MADDADRRSGGVIAGPSFFPDAKGRPRALELFFDLLFVFCVAQLAGLLRDDPVLLTAARMLLLFVPVWWTWVNVTFCADRFPTDDVVQRGLVLLAAAAAGAMGLGLADLAGVGSAVFACGYATGRVVTVVLYVRAARSVREAAPQCRWYAAGSSVSAVLWVGSLLLPVDDRGWVWGVATALDIAVPALIDRRLGLLPVDVHHLPDRCTAFVVIVLGESLVTTLTTAAERGTPLGATAGVLGLGFVVTAALWWGFFDRVAMRLRYERLEGDSSGRMANVICGYLHFPLIAGITVVAVGLQLASEHVDGAVPAAAAWALAGGSVAYLLTLDAITAVIGLPGPQSLRRERLGIAVALVVVALVGGSWATPVYVAAVAALLLVHVVANVLRARRDAGQEG